jgi:tRNA1(Val) A37 N6-methylase TrmN6
MDYLLKIIQEIKGVYYTPEKIQKKIETDFLIKNPPYDKNKRNRRNNRKK